jgi:hypothetical protein
LVLRLPVLQALGQQAHHRVVERSELAIECRIDPGRGVRDQDLGHGPFAQARADDASDVLAHLRRHVAIRIVRHDPHDGDRELRREAVDEIGEDGSLVLEVEVEGAARYACLLDDVVDGRLVVPAPSEDAARRGEDLLPALGLGDGRGAGLLGSGHAPILRQRARGTRRSSRYICARHQRGPAPSITSALISSAGSDA